MKEKIEDAYDWVMETEGRRLAFCCVCAFLIGFAVAKL